MGSAVLDVVVDRESEYAREIGERIVLARKEQSLTQVELAELVGVSPRSMQAYETGETIPYRQMKRIGEVVRRPTAWLLHGDDATELIQADRLERFEAQVEELTTLLRTLSEHIRPSS